MQNFRLSIAHMKFRQICTSIGSFCWKYIKFQLKYYREVMSPDTEEWCKIWKKRWFIISKITRIRWFFIPTLKSLKICTLTGPFCEKYLTFDLKKLSFMALKCHPKFEEKLTCSLENDMRNLANFHQNTWKCQNGNFDGIFLSKVENAWANVIQVFSNFFYTLSVIILERLIQNKKP